MNSLAIVDIDGTITDFYKIDHNIISTMYSNNRMIAILDKVLWKINSMDIITNSFAIFKIRILIYSIIYGTKYSENMKKYKMEYVKHAKKYFEHFMQNEYLTLKSNGYDILLLSCDSFDSCLNNKIKVVKNKRRYALKNILKGNYSNIYVIGNNYMDDIRIGLDLRKKSRFLQKVHIFYVGNSSIVKTIIRNKKVITCHTIKEAINKIC